MICFTLAAPTPSLNQTRKMHHAALARMQRDWAWEIQANTMGQRPATPWPRARVTIWRHSVRELDKDNAEGGVKGLVDVLKALHPKTNPRGLGIIADDSPKHLEQIVHQVRVARRTDQRTVVRVEPIFNVEPVSTAPVRVGEVA